MGVALWVIPCKFDATRPVIFDCIQAIQRHHENSRIVVVDSDSADTTYLQWCAEMGCGVADIHNREYALGAYRYAMRTFQAPYFYMIFDSLIVQSNLDHLQDKPVTTIRHWASTDHDWGWDANGEHLSVWGGSQLSRMGVAMPTSYHGVMGPMMMIQCQVADQLNAIGYWNTVTTSAYDQCAMERVTGIVLEHLGYDITQSIQGCHTTHDAIYDETYCKKVDLARS